MSTNYGYLNLDDVWELLKNDLEFLKSNTGSECIAAVLIGKFYEKYLDQNILIGFRTKGKYTKTKPGKYTIQKTRIKTFINEIKELATIVDFCITTENENILGVAKVMKFQVKRFGLGREGKNTLQLVKYIKKQYIDYAKKYPKEKDVQLLIMLQTGKKIEFPKIPKQLRRLNKTFLGLWCLGMTNTSNILFVRMKPGRMRMFEAPRNEVLSKRIQ